MATKKKVGRPKKAKKKPASEGLGDAIKKFTKAIGVKPCEGCNRRARMINKAFPFNVDKGQMTESQVKEWAAFKEASYKKLQDDKMDFLEDTYNAINHTNIAPCRNCGANGWLQIIKNIDKHYEQYI